VGLMVEDRLWGIGRQGGRQDRPAQRLRHRLLADAPCREGMPALRRGQMAEDSGVLKPRFEAGALEGKRAFRDALLKDLLSSAHPRLSPRLAGVGGGAAAAQGRAGLCRENVEAGSPHPARRMT
jgi:hypothetical protein